MNLSLRFLAVIIAGILFSACTTAIGFVSGDGSNSDDTGTCGTGQTVPAAVTLSRVGFNRATLSWQEPAGVVSYEMRSVLGSGTWDTATPVAAPALQPQPCGAGNTCQYRIGGLGLGTYQVFLRYSVAVESATCVSETATFELDTNFRVATLTNTIHGSNLGFTETTGDFDRNGRANRVVASSGHVWILKDGADLLSSDGTTLSILAEIDTGILDIGFADVRAGDVSCDGNVDLVINTTDAYLYFSKEGVTWSGTVALSGLNFDTISGDDITTDQHQPTIAAYQGTGCDDLLIGAPQAFVPDNMGAVLLMSNVTSTINDAKESNYGVFAGAEINQRGGYFIGNVGDVNGDARDEVVFTSRYFTTLMTPGSYLNNFRFVGQAANFLEDVAAVTTYDEVIGSLSDINGDGLPEFFISYPTNNGTSDGGTILIFLGAADMLTRATPFVPDFVLESDDDSTFGRGVAAGDIDNDGAVEVLVGSNDQITVYRYATSGSIERLDYVQTFPYAGVQLQIADLNEDGYLDLLTGNPTYNTNKGEIEYRY